MGYKERVIPLFYFLFTVGINKKVRVCCNGNATISVRAVPTIPTATAPTTPITTQTPIIGNANLVIDRRC